MLKAKLIVVGGDAKSGEVSLKLPTVIGRGKEAGLTVPHALVSRRHTEIFEQNGRLYARDLGSLNGTFVNNTKIEGDQLLNPDQLLTLGNITFRAVYEPTGPGLDADSQRDTDTLTFIESSTVEEPRSKITAPKQIVQTKAVPPPVPASPSKSPVQESAAPEKKSAAQVETMATPDSQSGMSEIFSFDEDSLPADALPASSVDPATSEKKQTSKADKKATPPSEQTDSEIFSLDTKGNSVKAISASAIDHLPNAKDNLVSFVGDFESGEQPASSKIDSFKIDLGENESSDTDVDNSRLDSFLKKLP